MSTIAHDGTRARTTGAQYWLVVCDIWKAFAAALIICHWKKDHAFLLRYSRWLKTWKLNINCHRLQHKPLGLLPRLSFVCSKGGKTPWWVFHKKLQHHLSGVFIKETRQLGTAGGTLRKSLGKAAFVARCRQGEECKGLTLGFLAYDSFHVFPFHIFRVKSLWEVTIKRVRWEGRE